MINNVSHVYPPINHVSPINPDINIFIGTIFLVIATIIGLSVFLGVNISVDFVLFIVIPCC